MDLLQIPTLHFGLHLQHKFFENIVDLGPRLVWAKHREDEGDGDQLQEKDLTQRSCEHPGLGHLHSGQFQAPGCSLMENFSLPL